MIKIARLTVAALLKCGENRLIRGVTFNFFGVRVLLIVLVWDHVALVQGEIYIGFVSILKVLQKEYLHNGFHVTFANNAGK